jgi:HK97 gp10 family phage protein
MARPEIRIDTSGLNRILRNLPGNRDRVVRRIAFEVEARAKQKAPVDTGALRASIYTRTSRDGALPPTVVTEAERVELPAPERDAAHVGPSVEYGLYQELGTSQMAAHAYLGPAVAEVRTNLEQFGEDFRRLAEGR